MYELNLLEKSKEVPFEDDYIEYLSLPLKKLIKRKRLPLDILQACDNATFFRFDLVLLPNSNLTLSQCLKELDTLENDYPNLMEIKIEQQRIKILCQKDSVDRQILVLRKLLESNEFLNAKGTYQLPIIIGETVDNNVLIQDLTKLPHLLVAGTTGSGKSVFLQNIILTLLYQFSPHELNFVFFDMKQVELALYDRLPYLLYPVCKEVEKAYDNLLNLHDVMEKRYKIFNESMVRNIAEYNEIAIQKMPYIVVIFDEFSNIIEENSNNEKLIKRLAQKARACGIHLILSTQKPTVEVITSQIKGNLPSKVAFKVSSMSDSRVILDENGADKLIKEGDLYFKCDDEKIRCQSPFVDTKEIRNIVNYMIECYGEYQPKKTNQNSTSNEDNITHTTRYKIGDNYNGMTVLDDKMIQFCLSMYHSYDYQGISMTKAKQYYNIGNRKAIEIVDDLKKYHVILEKENKDQKWYKFAYSEDDFIKYYISDKEVNECANV